MHQAGLIQGPITSQWHRKVPQSVCESGGGGGHTDTYIYVPSVKNQYKRDVTGYMVIYVTAICVSLLKFPQDKLIGI